MVGFDGGAREGRERRGGRGVAPAAAAQCFRHFKSRKDQRSDESPQVIGAAGHAPPNSGQRERIDDSKAGKTAMFRVTTV